VTTRARTADDPLGYYCESLGPRPIQYRHSAIFQGLLASRAALPPGAPPPLIPSHDLESVIWMILHMLIQYSPLVELYGIGRNQDTFATVQKTTLTSFDDATPNEKSFADERALIRSR
jgi:hypothetical protein